MLQRITLYIYIYIYAIWHTPFNHRDVDKSFLNPRVPFPENVYIFYTFIHKHALHIHIHLYIRNEQAIMCTFNVLSFFFSSSPIDVQRIQQDPPRPTRLHGRFRESVRSQV